MSEIQDLKNHILSLHQKINNLNGLIENSHQNDNKLSEVLNIIHNMNYEKSKQNQVIFESIFPDILRRITDLENKIKKSKSTIAQFKIGEYVVAFYSKYKRIGQITGIDEKGLITIDKGKLKFHPHQCKYQGDVDIFD